jgi:hypothetical protein
VKAHTERAATLVPLPLALLLLPRITRFPSCSTALGFRLSLLLEGAPLLHPRFLGMAQFWQQQQPPPGRA